jgi:hypothetical protein
MATVVAVYLPWLRSPNDSANAMDVPSLFLINNEVTDRGVELGILIFVGVGAALAALVVRGQIVRKVLLGAGIALIAMSVPFVIQVNQRVASMSYRALTDVLGVGPIVLLAAGGALVYVAVQLHKQPTTARSARSSPGR